MHFKGSDKLAKLIHANQFLLPVINRFGIRLGFKEKTVSEMCNEKGVDENFFLAIVNTYNNEDYFPESDLMSFSPKLIIDYLQKTHTYYFEYLIPEVERRLERVLNSCKESCNGFELIKSFYNKYKNELAKHLHDEDQYVFPYILALVEAYENKTPLPEVYKNYNVYSREQEHTNVDQKIYDLKNIVIKYIEPHYNDNDCAVFLNVIFQFERDLIDHARIEDKILEAKVIELEKFVKNG